MRRTALVLIAALVVGASAGFFVNNGTARTPQATRPAQPSSPGPRPTVHHAARAKVHARRVLKLGPARISIPRLHLRSRVFPAAELDLGPSWWPVTGRPGGGDTVAIAGHRTTHTHPFYYLERLRGGDVVYVTFRGRAYRYRVTRSWVIPSTNLHIADAVGHERLLLTACTPRGSAAFRLVVEARPSTSGIARADR
jgi:LPXTG-site transpeptidase (sortase) family protein